jgi:hypothetical protein
MPMKVPSVRKSGYDPDGNFHLKFVNDSDAKIEMFWIDYEGTPQSYGTTAPGDAFEIDTNSEHPWLVCSETSCELACFCVSEDGEVRMSALNASAETDKETKEGYLVDGGDFAAGVSQTDAERIVRTNPGKTMGYCFAHSNPDCCWVKVPGTGFCEGGGWTTVLFSTHDTYSRAKRKQRQKMHNVLNPDVEEHGDICEWVNCGDSICCAAMGKTYEKFEMVDFKVFIERGCQDKFPDLLEELNKDFAEVCRLLPEKALGLLRAKTAVWINDVLKYPGADKPEVGAWCHWGPGFPVSRGDLAEKGGCVEVCQVEHYMLWRSSQPALLLHELTHAFHCHNRAEIGDIIDDAYKRAMASGLYDTSERMGRSSNSKPYGATNSAEFFAESSEAFFSSKRFRNDYFPYIHAGAFFMQRLKAQNTMSTFPCVPALVLYLSCENDVWLPQSSKPSIPSRTRCANKRGAWRVRICRAEARFRRVGWGSWQRFPKWKQNGCLRRPIKMGMECSVQES